MKQDPNGRRGQRAWRGVTATCATVLALSISAGAVVDSFRTDIDKFLGTQSTQIVTEEADPATVYTYTSDYSSTTELLDAIEDLGERISEEGSVLLKNNGALPLTADETQKISLLGFSSYHPVQGGIMGSSLTPNTGTDADTVNMVQAFTAKGFAINPTLQELYTALESTYVTEVESWGGTTTYTNITAPSIGSVFSSKEPSQAAMDQADAGWKDTLNDYNVMIVTIARAGSENANYTPGTAGVDPTQNLNQTDPLGLSDDERDLIQAAVDAKAANGGKVIVLLNNASPMEIEELEANAGVDAILQIGLPGGYGFYGVADVLSGAAGFASPVSVFAVGQCRVLFLDYNRLLSCTLAQGPAVLKNMIQNISLKYFAQNRRMDILMMKSLREKITAYLLWQKQMSGTDEFDIDLDRRLLADFLAVERSALSRELSRMKKDGLIRYKKNHFKLFF